MGCCAGQGKRSSDTRLQTTGVAIGWLSAVIDIVHCFYFNSVLFSVDEYSRYLCKGLHLECVSSAELAYVALAIKVIVSINLYFSLTNMMASILVIHANAFKSHLMLLPWLGTNLFIVSLNVFSCYLLFLMDSLEFQIMAIIVLIHLGICCFMFVGIVLLYHKFITLQREIKLIQTQGSTSIQEL